MRWTLFGGLRSFWLWQLWRWVSLGSLQTAQRRKVARPSHASGVLGKGQFKTKCSWATTRLPLPRLWGPLQGQTTLFAQSFWLALGTGSRLLTKTTSPRLSCALPQFLGFQTSKCQQRWPLRLRTHWQVLPSSWDIWLWWSQLAVNALTWTGFQATSRLALSTVCATAGKLNCIWNDTSGAKVVKFWLFCLMICFGATCTSLLMLLTFLPRVRSKETRLQSATLSWDASSCLLSSGAGTKIGSWSFASTRWSVSLCERSPVVGTS